MPSIPTLHADDPVSVLIDGCTRLSGCFPVPLIATSYDITIAGGLTCVTARRTFRNQEANTIEATLTFPVPVHAVLYALEARIGGRSVKAVAKDKSAARETYEEAIDRGKTAVLHEEPLKGIHMLSVAHVAPGTEIEVTVRFAQPLSWVGGRAMLRIPTTVGDVYGLSGLSDADELVHGGPVTAADLKVACETGTSALIGGVPVGEGMRVALDRPIVIEVAGWTRGAIRGRTAAGETFTLRIAPVAAGDAAIDAALLIDHSGSMSDTCALGAGLTKHAAVLLGLGEMARALKDPDRINLWQFDDRAEDLGTTHGGHVQGLIKMLSGPRGGTEIGRAIDTLLAQRRVGDVILVTDGNSHALDVQKLAATGVRFAVVLIGENSLEANVGHLAALTGGEIFVADGTDVAGALTSMLASLRATPQDQAELGGHLVRGRRGGMEIVATRETSEAAAETEASEMVRAAGAYAAGLRLGRLSAAEAARLAVSEGLVTHLTSLILVDEEGATQVGLPAMRKVELPTPATYAPVRQFAARQQFSHGRSKSVGHVQRSAAPPPPGDYDFDDAPCAAAPEPPEPSEPPSASRGAFRFKVPNLFAKSKRRAEVSSTDDAPKAPRLTQMPRRIDWRGEGQRLVEGILIGLPHDIADAIDAAALVGVVRRAAKRIGVSPRVLVIGLLARAVSGSDRHAERVYRAILFKAKTHDIVNAAERLGLSMAEVARG